MRNTSVVDMVPQHSVDTRSRITYRRHNTPFIRRRGSSPRARCGTPRVNSVRVKNTCPGLLAPVKADTVDATHATGSRLFHDPFGASIEKPTRNEPGQRPTHRTVSCSVAAKRNTPHLCLGCRRCSLPSTCAHAHPGIFLVAVRATIAVRRRNVFLLPARTHTDVVATRS